MQLHLYEIQINLSKKKLKKSMDRKILKKKIMKKISRQMKKNHRLL